MATALSDSILSLGSSAFFVLLLSDITTVVLVLGIGVFGRDDMIVIVVGVCVLGCMDCVCDIIILLLVDEYYLPIKYPGEWVAEVILCRRIILFDRWY